MKISNISQVALMGWTVGFGITNGLPLLPMLTIALLWSIPLIIANVEFGVFKHKLKNN